MGVVGNRVMSFRRTQVCYAVPAFIVKPCCSYGCHRDPVSSVHQMKLEADGLPEGSKRLASTIPKQHVGIEGLTLAELSAKWIFVVEALKKDGVKVTNPDHALEGALLIRCTDSESVECPCCCVCTGEPVYGFRKCTCSIQ